MKKREVHNKDKNQGRERNPNPDCLVRIFSGGVFHMKEWGPKSSVCPSKLRETKLSRGIALYFGRDIPGGCPGGTRNF